MISTNTPEKKLANIRNIPSDPMQQQGFVPNNGMSFTTIRPPSTSIPTIPNLNANSGLTYTQILDLFTQFTQQLSNGTFNPYQQQSQIQTPINTNTTVPLQTALPNHSYSLPTSSIPHPFPFESLHSSIEETAALSEDVETLYQEVDKVKKFQSKQKEINKTVELIIRDKYNQQKQEEKQKKQKKELATRYQNPTHRQKEAARKIQRWFRTMSLSRKNKKMLTMSNEIEMLKYQVERLQIENKTSHQLLRLLFEQVQYLTREFEVQTQN